MTAPSAWQIEQAMSALMSGRAALLANDPDLAADEALLSEALKPEATDVYELLNRVLRAAVDARTMAEAADVRVKDLTARRDRYAKRAETLRGTAFSVMDALGLSRLELPDMTASIARGVPRPIVTNEEDIPDKYWRTTRSIDRVAVNDAIKQGVVIPGVEVTNVLPRLQVRTK